MTTRVLSLQPQPLAVIFRGEIVVVCRLCGALLVVPHVLEAVQSVKLVHHNDCDFATLDL